uniref:thiol oxidase n=1 Tax=viral metagenome TaxID=1070528 RepID=A0A6C0LJY0_9ZZZZ
MLNHETFNILNSIMLKARVWGPSYWFVLMTIAVSYPIKPNTITKKKYYEFIHNLPLFIPDEHIGNKFSKLLDKYPITPYLDSREMFTRWVHFIHNRINVILGKPEVTLGEAMSNYHEKYKEEIEVVNHFTKWKKVYLYAVTLLFLIMLCYILY